MTYVLSMVHTITIQYFAFYPTLYRDIITHRSSGKRRYSHHMCADPSIYGHCAGMILPPPSGTP
jgi:hypothetical protein